MGWLRRMWEDSSDLPKSEWRRVAERRIIQGKVDIRIGDKIIYGEIRDISPTGLGLICREAVPLVGVSVSPSFTEDWLVMRITHCTQTVGGYKVGLTTTEQERS